MEDLIGFIIVIMVAVVNLLASIAKKRQRKRQASEEGEGVPTKKPSSIEEFFESLAEKLEPKPVEMPDWPDEIERPDYAQEQEEFETAQAAAFEEGETAEIIPMPPPAPPPSMEVPAKAPAATMAEQSSSLRMAMKSMPSGVAGIRGMRIATAPILRSGRAGSVHFELKDKADLRKAILANIVFSPPRAFDASFENTIVK